MKKVKLISARDILGYDFAGERDKQIRIEDGSIVFVKHHYSVELNRCTNKESILQWVHHLNGKAWMTTELTEWFIELATQYHGINLYEKDY